MRRLEDLEEQQEHAARKTYILTSAARYVTRKRERGRERGRGREKDTDLRLLVRVSVSVGVRVRYYLRLLVP